LKTLIKGLLVLVSLGFLSGLFVLGVIIYISFDLPQINSLADYNPPIPSKIYSKDGELLLEIYQEKRDITKMEEIPQKVVDAFLAAEDDNFYNHSGVDYIGIVRAMVKNIKAGRIVQGASTITQQVAKSLLLSSERTFTRKIKDLLLAKRIEDKFTKQEILFLYLNQVYLGGGYYGIKSAFKGYFNKELSEATTAEAALVAGLLVAPGKYSPYVNPQYAKTRQKYVLKRLFKTEKISEVEYQSSLNENIRMKIKEPNLMKAGYFTDWIRQKLVAHFGKKDFLTNGYSVVTTIDWALQKKAQDEVKKGVEAIDRRQGFKGPVAQWSDEKTQNEKLLSARKEIYNRASNFFTFYKDGSVKNEFEYEEGEFEKILEAQKAQADLVKRYKIYFEPGNVEGDRAIELLDLTEDHEALVTKVSNSQQIIYVSIGGVKAIIPYSGFRWAHERNISEERNYWSYQKYPERIVKPGDVVLVRFDDRDMVTVAQMADNDFMKRYKKPKDKEMFSTEKFLKADLVQDPEAQGALISISPQSGEIISMVGGSDFNKSQFNRAVQSNRQPGSAFKPIIFASGIENGFTPASILLDSPQALGGVDDSLSWKPRNYDGKFKGEMTLRKALETSRNIPTIRLSQQVGVDKIKNLVERVKVDAELPNDLSVSLGSFGINLLDLVKLYSIFPNGGRKVKIKSIISITGRDGKLHFLEDRQQDPGLKDEDEPSEPIKDDISEALEKPKEIALDENGEPIEEEKEDINPFLVNLNEDQVYDSRLAYIMTNLLKGVIQNGTGRGARNISSFIGGKTGTTNNYVDAWFLGFSSKLVTGVWTGFDNNDTLGWGETGAKSALPIWKAFMDLGIKRLGEYDFQTPSGIVNVSINPVTGKLSKSGGQNSFMESFVEGTEPGSVDEETEKDEEDNTSINYVDEDYYISQ